MLLAVFTDILTLFMSIKFHDNILNGFQVIEGTQNYHCRISNGNISKNVLIRVTVLVCLIKLYISIKFH